MKYVFNEWFWDKIKDELPNEIKILIISYFDIKFLIEFNINLKNCYLNQSINCYFYNKVLKGCDEIKKDYTKIILDNCAITGRTILNFIHDFEWDATCVNLIVDENKYELMKEYCSNLDFSIDRIYDDDERYIELKSKKITKTIMFFNYPDDSHYILNVVDKLDEENLKEIILGYNRDIFFNYYYKGKLYLKKPDSVCLLETL